MKWIKGSESLPDMRKECLIITRDSYGKTLLTTAFLNRRDKDNYYWRKASGHALRKKDVFYWIYISDIQVPSDIKLGYCDCKE